MENRKLAESRRELRSVDSELVAALARRNRLVRKIGALKRKLKVGVIDVATEKAAMENFVRTAAKAGLDKSYARRVGELLIEFSVDSQLRSRPSALPGDAQLKQLAQMMRDAERKGRKLIRFDVGEPRFKPPTAVIKEAKRFLTRSPTMLYGSSAGLTELLDAVAARLNKQYGTRLTRSNVLIVPGGRFGIFAAIRTHVASLERVVVCQPAWPAYQSFMNLVGGRLISVPTSLEEKWDINLAALEEALKLRPKMLILNNPSNPTGKVLSPKRFQEIMKLARKYHTTILSDEVYTTYSNTRVPSVLEYPGSEAVYINSFSKEFSMTGWRVAYVVSDEQRILKMRRILEGTLTNVPEVVQRAALAALKDPSDQAAASRRRIMKCLGIASEELKKGEFELYVPDGGFYVFPRMKRKGIDSAKFAEYLFTKHAVGVLPGTIFGGYEGFLRLAVTEPEKAVRTGVKRIVTAMNEW